MPCGTYGTVKGMTPLHLRETGTQILLGNTFHLMLRPGADVVESLGGLHGFMGWDGPILTDSGGFQVWSLGAVRKIREEGVEFRSPVDGDKVFLTPESSVSIQQQLGADIIMVLDECTPYESTEAEVKSSMQRSLRWAERCRMAHSSDGALFGIVQGGMHPALRDACLDELQNIGFGGYAIGGLSVGESKQEMMDVIRHVAPRMPNDAPRYLMGVGTPQDLLESVQGLWADDFHETVVNGALLERGHQLWLTPAATVHQEREGSLREPTPFLEGVRLGHVMENTGFIDQVRSGAQDTVHFGRMKISA